MVQRNIKGQQMNIKSEEIAQQILKYNEQDLLLVLGE
jgi:hypothetical protein